MITFFDRFRTGRAAVRALLAESPRLLTIAAGLGVLLFLLQWSDDIGMYFLTRAGTAPPPDRMWAPYVLAKNLIQVAYYYLLAVALTGCAGYLKARHARQLAPGEGPAAGIVARGLRVAHWQVLIFIAVALLQSVLTMMLLQPYLREGITMVELWETIPPTLHLVFFVVQLAAQLFFLLYALQVAVRPEPTATGFAWFSAAMTQTWAELRHAGAALAEGATLLTGGAYLALGMLFFAPRAWFFLSPVTSLPLALLYAIAEAVLLPVVLALFIAWAPAPLPAAATPGKKKGG